MLIERFIKYNIYFLKGFIKNVLLTKHFHLFLNFKLYDLDSNFINFFKFLKLFMKFNICVDIVSVDWLNTEFRFEVFYNLISVTNLIRIFVGIKVSDSLSTICNRRSHLPSIAEIYKGAGWMEREIWDMYGIFFSNNKDLRRILTDYGFEGFPLRKDFPLTGFVEVRYDDEQKSIVYENVELSQEFRFFDFETPWNIKNNE
jgi:NADH-quinone oxidoreductase subunit C